MKYFNEFGDVTVQIGDMVQNIHSDYVFFVGAIDESDDTIMDRDTGTWYDIVDIDLMHGGA